MFKLDNTTQRYAWGKKGKDSVVAVLKASSSTGGGGVDADTFTINEHESYAELWMGTHPNGASKLCALAQDLEGVNTATTTTTTTATTTSRSVKEGGRHHRHKIYLTDLLQQHPEYLGNDLSSSGEQQGDLPFMFKVLSIHKALSIQAHPDKETAERIYAARPDLYKDDNHKPEMAVALTDFEGLCGFRPFQEILVNLFRYPELRGLVSLSAVNKMCTAASGNVIAQRCALQAMFQSFLKAKSTTVKTQLTALVHRIEDEAAEEAATLVNQPLIADVRAPFCGAVGDGDGGGGGGGVNGFIPPPPGSISPLDSGFRRFCSTSSVMTDMTDTSTTESEANDDDVMAEDVFGADDEDRFDKLRHIELEDVHVRRLMLRLNDEYPGDIGIMMPLLLNYLRMGKGESFFMAANEPHAYLRGDLLEVMARSDNVVRVALTPKYCDVPLLCEILSYSMGAPPLINAVQEDTCKLRYTPPIKDFELEMICVDAMIMKQQPYVLTALPVPQLMICLEGSGIVSTVSSSNTSNDDKDGHQHDQQVDKEQKVWPGVSFFIKAHQAVTIICDNTRSSSLRIAIAHTNTHFQPGIPVLSSSAWYYNS